MLKVKDLSLVISNRIYNQMPITADNLYESQRRKAEPPYNGAGESFAKNRITHKKAFLHHNSHSADANKYQDSDDQQNS